MVATTALWWRVVGPEAERVRVFRRWWVTLSRDRQRQARQVEVGAPVPGWLWRTLMPQRGNAPIRARAGSGDVVGVMPTELHDLIGTSPQVSEDAIAWWARTRTPRRHR